jgi:pSer/pThr/pTyr-binding forkhead associated (FHA) protein
VPPASESDANRKAAEAGLPLESLAVRARELRSVAAFTKAYPAPALLLIANAPAEDGLTPTSSPAKAKGSGGFNIVTLEGAAAQGSKVEARRFNGRVVFVAKRPGNPFANMISLGRAASNDVVIALDTISKLHGYFLREGDAWYYTDYQSTNGTHVNHKRVDKGEKLLLADGDRFTIGLDVLADFLLPASLYERVRGGLS